MERSGLIRDRTEKMAKLLKSFQMKNVDMELGTGRLIMVRLFLYGLLFFVVLLVSYARFGPWMPSVFFGDDLSNIIAFKEGLFAASPITSLSEVYLGKFRPVFSFAMYLQFSSFAEWIEGYLGINLLVHSLSGVLVFLIARNLSGGNLAIAGLAALSAVISRFALYQTTQVTGLVEGLSTFTFLLMLFCVIRSKTEFAWRWSLLAVLAATLTMHTHERYIVLLPWLALAILIMPRTTPLGTKAKLALVGLCALGVVFNVGYKMAALNGKFLIGTGGTTIEFDLLRILEHTSQATLSIFGFNHGPDYLVGVNWFELPIFSGWILGAVLVTASALLMVRVRGAQAGELVFGLLLFLLGAVALFPTLLTIRMEQRWEYQPFIVLLLILSWTAGLVARPQARLISSILMTVVACASITIDLMVTRFTDRVFFVNSAKIAQSTYEDIFIQDPGARTPVAFVLEDSHCNWTLLGGAFFKLYSGHMRSVRCIPNLTEIRIAPNERLYVSDGMQLVDVTQQALVEMKERESRISFDFIKNFDQGQINDTRPVDTPSQLGIIQMPWDGIFGRQETLTVLPGFSYRFDNVALNSGDAIVFGLSMLFPAPERALAKVTILDSNGKVIQDFSTPLNPPIPDQKVKFLPFRINLNIGTAESVSVIFSAASAGEDETAQWIAFDRPRLISGASKGGSVTGDSAADFVEPTQELP